ncbi:MAG: hypothetical protein NTY64_16735 [Deltaproteobacteria bacterium]|nr:hypothetical protein [Deltaproteobacteria bacterium]
MSLLFPLWPAYAIVPVGMALIVIQAIFDIIRPGATLFFELPKMSD